MDIYQCLFQCTDQDVSQAISAFTLEFGPQPYRDYIERYLMAPHQHGIGFLMGAAPRNTYTYWFINRVCKIMSARLNTFYEMPAEFFAVDFSDAPEIVVCPRCRAPVEAPLIDRRDETGEVCLMCHAQLTVGSLD